jgi:hypothetical protein
VYVKVTFVLIGIYIENKTILHFLALDPQKGGNLSLKAIEEALDVFSSDAYISGISDNSGFDKT